MIFSPSGSRTINIWFKGNFFILNQKERRIRKEACTHIDVIEARVDVVQFLCTIALVQNLVNILQPPFCFDLVGLVLVLIVEALVYG
jgi:hypothetical protein